MKRENKIKSTVNDLDMLSISKPPIKYKASIITCQI